MPKDYKVKRYDYGNYRKNKRKRAVSILTVVLILGAAAVGWLAYEPIYNYVMNIKASSSSVSESAPSSSESLPASSESEPEAEPEVFPARSAYLPAQSLTDTAALPQLFADLKAAGDTGVFIDLKDADGAVLYRSALPKVTELRVQSETAYDLSAVLAAAKEAGVTVTGRLWAFRDPAAARMMYSAAVKYNYTDINWVDDSLSNGGKPWLNPNNADARAYLLSLVQETTSMGLTQLQLVGAQFPDGYSLSLATYGEKGAAVDFSAVLADFVASASAEAEKNGARLWNTVDLLSTTGVRTNRYGKDLARVIGSSRGIVLDIAPSQFGAGVTAGDFSLASPVLDPYNTVKAALAASPAIDPAATEIVAQVQGATAALAAGNKEYGAAEIDAQIQAASEAGIRFFFVYDPSGTNR